MNTITLDLDPKSPATITLILGRKRFNSFLSMIHDCEDDSWKAAQIELTGGQVASAKFDRIEVFTDTLIGPIVALREESTEDVHVTMQRPTDGIYRTADDIVEAVYNRDIPWRK